MGLQIDLEKGELILISRITMEELASKISYKIIELLTTWVFIWVPRRNQQWLEIMWKGGFVKG